MKKVERIKLEMVAKSLDTIRVHNPTLEDFVIWNNRSQTNGIPAQKWTIPSVNKDVGYGKGNLDLPRFAAKKYIKGMTTLIINREWEVEWEKLKKKYRRDEWERVEQRMTPKTNDLKKMEEILPTLWVGLVHEQEIPEDALEDNRVEQPKSGLEGLMDKMGLNQKIIESTKEEFAEAINETE